MGRRCTVAACLVGLLLAGPAQAGDLTATEQAWLDAALPVLAYAQDQGWPLDIIVQPQPTPGETPLGMAFVGGRCKLVLSMRGNAEAQATLDSLTPNLVGPVVEAIAAHELAHCWRHLQRNWGTLPSRVQVSSLLDRVPADVADILREMWRTRREEGYADLVGLAWTLQHHPEYYGAVHAWHVALRAEQVLDTGPHDTRVWVQLAADPHQLEAAGTVFERVEDLWLAGLLAGG